jgi:sister chromatid cohesion protein PDS5
MILQDTCFNVRNLFLHKLIGFLGNQQQKLPNNFNLILFLTAHDPEDENRELVSSLPNLVF